MTGSGPGKANTVWLVIQATTTPTAMRPDRDGEERPLVPRQHVRIGRAEVGDADRRLDDQERDERADDPGRECQEPADANVIGPQLEDAAAGPEAGHQADDAGDRREERSRRTGATRDRQDRPDEVRQDAGQRARPRPCECADEDGPDRIEIDRQAERERRSSRRRC